MKYKIVVSIVGLLALGVGGFLYMKSPTSEPLLDGVLIRETMSAMGSETITTVIASGQVSVISDFPGQSTDYILTPVQMNQINDVLAKQDGTVHTFAPDPGIVYDGTYSLQLKYNNGSITHTQSIPEYEALMQLVRAGEGE